MRVQNSLRINAATVPIIEFIYHDSSAPKEKYTQNYFKQIVSIRFSIKYQMI